MFCRFADAGIMAFPVCLNRALSENCHRFKPNSNIRCEILLNIEHKEFNKSDLRSARDLNCSHTMKDKSESGEVVIR